jgi:predicted Zn-dependent peptidase
MILHSTVLENGLRVYVHSVAGVRTVTFSIWIDQGSKDEEGQYNGVSHMVEHLACDLASSDREATEIWADLQAVGARCNATTTKEFTYYFITLMPEHAALACRALLKMMTLQINAESLERERKVILQEYAMHIGSTEQIYDRFAQSIWGDNGLGQMVIGREEVITGTSMATLQAYGSSRYSADRAGFVVVGDIDHQRVFELAEQHFGRWADAKECPTPIEVGLEPTILVVRNNSDQVTLSVGANSFPYDSPRRHHVELIAKLLGAGMNSRLAQSIRHKRGLAYYVSAYTQTYKAAGLLSTVVKCHQKDVSEVIKLILHEFGRLRNEPVSDQELNQAKELVRTDKYLEVENTPNRMRLIGRSAMLGESFSLNSYLRLIRTVSTAQIQDTARELFRRKNFAAAAIGAVNEEELLNSLTGRGT